MTPSMILFEMKKAYRDNPQSALIANDIKAAFRLGHKFGLHRGVEVIDQCERGHFSHQVAAARIRALKVVEVKPVATIDKDFL